MASSSSFTDMLMANPWMLDPSQQSNQFSSYNNAPLPFPPSYAGTPVNAATGKPIQSFLDWQQQNPGGMTINQTPAQPQAPATPTIGAQALQAIGMGGLLGSLDPQKAAALQEMVLPGSSRIPGVGGQTQTAPAAPQASGPPNNWGAALSALANPGNPVTPGATVPLTQGFQPSGGVNAAFLQNAQGRPGMNQNFLSALAAIQGRPQ
jgi:hypothetical protein